MMSSSFDSNNAAGATRIAAPFPYDLDPGMKRILML